MANGERRANAGSGRAPEIVGEGPRMAVSRGRTAPRRVRGKVDYTIDRAQRSLLAHNIPRATGKRRSRRTRR